MMHGQWDRVVIACSVAACALACLTASLVSAADVAPAKPTLIIVGDSTVRNSTKGQRGWGEQLGEYFDTTRINVVNRAIGGRSSRTFITEGRWQEVCDAAKPGDFVLIQFGHNDSIAPDDPQRPRGTLRGIGEETREITHPVTKKPETVHTYGWYLRKYVSDARAKGMTPIICSPVPRVPSAKLTEPLAAPSGYALWASEVAKAEGVPFIDLSNLISRHYVGMQPADIKAKYFCDDNTHTSPEGAAFNAAVVADTISKLKNCELVAHLRKDAPSTPK